MLTNLQLEHFKCFRSQTIPLNRLTVLSGLNGSGKSSVLQALVLLGQCMRDHEWSTRLPLNGSSLELGTITDVVEQVTGRRSFTIEISSEKATVCWSFEGLERQAMSAGVAAIRAGDTLLEANSWHTPLCRLLPNEASREQHSIATRLSQLSYLTAERLGPRDLYPLHEAGDSRSVGCRGEFAVSLLHSKREQLVEKLALKDRPPTLFQQVVGRMRQFFPSFYLEVNPILHTNSVQLGIKTSEATEFHRPTHVGFGLTQVLPIVVAVLCSKSDDLLLLENPEVHLHPAGQAQMGMFLAEAAQAGQQIILETHSDHIINGIRRAVKSGLMEASQATIHFIAPQEDGSPRVSSPRLDRHGNLDHWPTGFFDQFEKDANFFAGWGH